MLWVDKDLQDPAQKIIGPPRAEFRMISEILQLKQGKRKVHAYAQHRRYLAICMVAKPVSEFV